MTSASGREGRETAGWRANLLLTLPFLLLLWVQIHHHQSWFDELNAWGLAAASPNLKTLFHFVHYEGHPWLWYFLLYCASRLTHNPDQMKWIVAAFSTGSLLLIGLQSPFTRWQKVLVFLSYFVVYEYTVTLRMYCIVFFLALLYTWRRSTHPDAILSNLLLLGLMTNVDGTGVQLSAVLLLEYGYTLWRRGRVSRRTAWPLAGGLVLYAGLLAVSVHSVSPAPDMSWQASGPFGSHALIPRFIIALFADVVSAPWWPISPELPSRFWETDSHRMRFLFVLIPLVLYGYWASFRRRRNLLLLVFGTVLVAFAWADLIYVGRVRHWGICFAAFLIALWLRQADRTAQEPVSLRRQPWSAWTYGLLGMSVVAGLIATTFTWVHPMSQSRTAADWIRTHEPADVTLVGEPDVSVISVAQHLNRPVFLLECDCFSQVKLFSRRFENFPDTEDISRLNRGFSLLGKPEVLFILWHSLNPREQRELAQAHLQATPVAQFPGADSLLESYYLYRVRRA